MKEKESIKLTSLQILGLDVRILRGMEKYPEFKKRVLEVVEQARLRNEIEKE